MKFLLNWSFKQYFICQILNVLFTLYGKALFLFGTLKTCSGLEPVP